jgi:hypothetical protein
MLGGAAGGGHVLRIVDGESKLAFEAGIAHPVTAGELSGFGGREVIGHADYTFDPGKGVSGVEASICPQLT